MLPPGQSLSDQRPAKKATIYLVALYRKCQPQYPYRKEMKDYKMPITKPSEKVQNGGCDNCNGDYVFKVGDYINDTSASGRSKTTYLVESLLGQGSFGQVLKCLDINTHASYAIKVIKNLPAYNQQAQLERKILRKIKEKDPLDKRHCLRLVDDFVFHGHMCFVTEMLGEDLYTILKQGKFRGLSLSLISVITAQLVDVLNLLSDMEVIHSDMKPENILLDRCLPRVKVIDFGSAVFERQVLYTYIQSRYYRAPEVLCGSSYDSRIDMWSVGCIAAELFLGHPIFPGQSEHDQITRIIRMLGPFPRDMVLNGKTFKKNFVLDTSSQYGYRLMTWQENAKLTGQTKVPRQYSHIGNTLEETIENYVAKMMREGNALSRSMSSREPFLHFLRSVLQVDPKKRLTPYQALHHPFITRKPWTGSWTPPTDPKRSGSTAARSGTRGFFDGAKASVTAPFDVHRHRVIASSAERADGSAAPTSSTQTSGASTVPGPVGANKDQDKDSAHTPTGTHSPASANASHSHAPNSYLSGASTTPSHTEEMPDGLVLYGGTMPDVGPP